MGVRYAADTHVTVNVYEQPSGGGPGSVGANIADEELPIIRTGRIHTYIERLPNRGEG